MAETLHPKDCGGEPVRRQAAPLLPPPFFLNDEARARAELEVLCGGGKAHVEGRAERIDRCVPLQEPTEHGPSCRVRQGGEGGVLAGLHTLFGRHLTAQQQPGAVAFVGAGPGDPDLLTLKARKLLDEADVIVHDRLVPAPILELARREAMLIAMGKEGFGPSATQDDINDTLVAHAKEGAQVVRLKAGDASVFGRLDEEIAAIDAAGIDWQVVPGITAASAAAASLGQSLTRRGRNSDLRLLTGHDVEGLAEHDWRTLARPGAVAGIYMAKRGARFLQGRLLMHGADPATPVSVVENASRPDQRIVPARLATLAEDIKAANLTGPAILLYGLAPRRAAETALPAVPFQPSKREHA